MRNPFESGKPAKLHTEKKRRVTGTHKISISMYNHNYQDLAELENVLQDLTHRPVSYSLIIRVAVRYLHGRMKDDAAIREIEGLIAENL